MELDRMETTAAEDEGVKVSVRVRPLNARELGREDQNVDIWTTSETTISLDKGGSSGFDFDNVFTPPCTNRDVYDKVASMLVKSAVDGFNGVIFAYGQTSSGKTHTMQGVQGDEGITPLAVQDVFRHVTDSTDREFLLRVSYIEIYNEVIKDLLCPGQDNLKIHEDFTGRVFVDAREEVVTSVDDVLGIMRLGEEQRTFGATNMNERSSRSHTIFTVIIESRLRSDLSNENDGVAVCVSTLSLVDLAGSERVSHTGAEGVRLKEGGHINKSLLTLGTVINKLTEGATGHIPYRDSKLTRILQPALGGNARTSIICAVTPAEMHVEETLSTLKFASRAKCVHNRTSRNEILDDRAMLRRCQKEVQQLKQLLASVQSGTAKNLSELSTEEGLLGLVVEAALPSAEKERLASQLASSERTATELQAKVERLSKLLVGVGGGGEEVEEDPGEQDGRGKRPRKRGNQEDNWRRQTLDNVDGRSLRSSSASGKDAEEKVERLAHQLAAAERSAFEAVETAEKQRRAMDIEYQALRNEVAGLALHAEEAEKGRHLASLEAERAAARVAVVDVVAVVEEIVWGSMLQSEQNAKETFSQSLQDTERQREDLHKELDLALKRERAGTAPIVKQVEFLKAKLLELEAKFKAARTTNSRLEAEKSQAERDAKTFEKQVRALENLHGKELEKTARDLERNKDNEIKAKTVQMDALSEELDRLRREKCEQDATLESVRGILAQVEVDLQQKEVELDEARRGLHTAQKDSKEKINALEVTIRVQEEEKTGLQAQIVDLETLRTNAASENETLNSKIAEWERSSLQWVDEKKVLDASIHALSQENERHRSKIESLKKDRQDLVDSYQRASTERQTEHQEGLEKLQARLDQEKAVEVQQTEQKLRDEAEEERTQHAVDLEQLCRELSQLRDEHQALQSLPSQLEAKAAEAKAAILRAEDAEQRAAAAQTKMECVETELQGTQTDFEAVSAQLQQSQREVLRTSETVKEVERLREREAVLEQEIGLLKNQMEEKTACEAEHTEKLLREKQRIMERYHDVERARRKLEIGLEEWRTGSGRVGTLERKLERRELQLKKKDRELKLMEERVVLGGGAKDWLEAKRVSSLEAKAEAADQEASRLEKRVAAVESERMALVREVDQLRDAIQDRDRTKLELEIRMNTLVRDSQPSAGVNSAGHGGPQGIPVDEVENAVALVNLRNAAAKPPRCPPAPAQRERLALREIQPPP